MNDSFDVFVSYSSDDGHLVEGLVRLLQLSGRRVFVDRNSIEPGTLWEHALRQAIAACEQFVLLWCCHSTASSWVATEIQQAVADAKPIIPLLLRGEPVPEPVSKYQWIDLRNLVAHSCDHMMARNNLKVIDGRYIMPPIPGIRGFTYLDTLSAPDEHLARSLAHDTAAVSAMRLMSEESIAFSGIVFRALELETLTPNHFRLTER